MQWHNEVVLIPSPIIPNMQFSSLTVAEHDAYLFCVTSGSHSQVVLISSEPISLNMKLGMCLTSVPYLTYQH